MEKQQASVKSKPQHTAAIDQAVPMKNFDKHRIPGYKRRIVQLEKLIESREALVAESARSVGDLQASVDALKKGSLPVTGDNQIRLVNSQKALRFARRQLQEDEMDLNAIKDSLEVLKFKLEAAGQ